MSSLSENDPEPDGQRSGRALAITAAVVVVVIVVVVLHVTGIIGPGVR